MVKILVSNHGEDDGVRPRVGYKMKGNTCRVQTVLIQ
jgi:hypothetical protein